MNFLTATGSYLWNILQSIGGILWTVINGLIKRLFLLVFHVISGPYYFILSFVSGFSILFNDSKKWTRWLGKSLLNLLAWIGRLISKTLDIILLGELLDLIFQLIKPKQRTLSKSELEEAKKVFGNGLTYWQVRIDEKSLLAWLGAKYNGSENLGVTTFHTINFTRRLNTSPGNDDMNWLIHELAHVVQMEHAGVQYIVEALVAQNTGGYHYGSPKSLEGKRLKDFNTEQQAEIAAHYYQDVLYGTTAPEYFKHLIAEFQNANKLWF